METSEMILLVVILIFVVVPIVTFGMFFWTGYKISNDLKNIKYTPPPRYAATECPLIETACKWKKEGDGCNAVGGTSPTCNRDGARQDCEKWKGRAFIVVNDNYTCH